MKIIDVTLSVLELPEKVRHWDLAPIPNLRRVQYTHRPLAGEAPLHQSFLRVLTDEGVEGIASGGTPETVEVLRPLVIGEDPLARERLYQKLQRGTRWLYQRPGWWGSFDNALWDIAGKIANLPIYRLVGEVRPSVPAYFTSGDKTLADYLADIEQARREWGIAAYKLHSYKGGKADIPILRAVRREVGPDYALLHDPVCSYTLREAIEVGHVMEELDFVWLEEPFYEQELRQLQELCAALTIPVMANETLMHDANLSAQWLLARGTDLLRGSAVFGTTNLLKLAHFAELYGANVEINALGGLFGLVHTHLECAIANTEFFEFFGDHYIEQAHECGLLNPPVPKDGRLAPPDGPGWGAEWDRTQFRKRTVAEY